MNEPAADRSVAEMGISVIVCTHNGGATIGETLAALQEQTGLGGTRYEVILVDNASTDDSLEVARKAWHLNDVPLRLMREPRLGLSHARAAGCLAARFPLICWVDDDNILAPNYLSYGVRLMERHPGAGMCGGHGQAHLPPDVPAWFTTQTAAYALGPQGGDDGPISKARGFVYGAGAILRRKALEDLAAIGFPALLSGRNGNELTAGEDAEICYALRLLGWDIIQSCHLSFQHVIPPSRLTLDYCRRLFTGFGKAEVVLNIYRLYQGPSTLGRSLHRCFPLFNLRKRLRSAARKDERVIRAAAPGIPKRMREYLAESRAEEAARLESSGDLFRYIGLVRAFEKCARHFRSKAP